MVWFRTLKQFRRQGLRTLDVSTFYLGYEITDNRSPTRDRELSVILNFRQDGQFLDRFGIVRLSRVQVLER